MNELMIESDKTSLDASSQLGEATKDSRKISENLNHQNKQTVLLLINPHSGRGKSVKIYKSKLIPFLNSHQINHEVFITESESRVSDYINSRSAAELCSYKSIVVVSGDGLFHELVNALMSRPDKDKLLDIPVGLVPTGSGNGLAYTLIRQKQPDIKSVDEAIKLCCEQAIQDETCPTDLVKVTFGRNTTIWSFLSFGWGLLADIDIDSEWLRRFGEIRFTIYGILRALTSVTYRGKLSFKLATGDPTAATNGSKDEYTNQKLIGPISSTLRQLYQNSKNGWVHVEDQLIYLTYIQDKISFCQVIKFLLAIEDGSHDNLPFVTVVPVTTFKFEPLDASKIVIDGERIPWELSDGPLSAEIVPNAIKLAWSA